MPNCQRGHADRGGNFGSSFREADAIVFFGGCEIPPSCLSFNVLCLNLQNETAKNNTSIWY